MNWDQIEGNWKQLKGNIQQQWAKLTDDDLDGLSGKREELAGKIQETYGINKNEAEKQLNDWQNKQTDSDDESEDELDSISNSMNTNREGYDVNINNGLKQHNLGKSPRSMQDAKGDSSYDNDGPSDGAGVPGNGESDEMDDSGNPKPNPMPDDLDEPAHANGTKTPH